MKTKRDKKGKKSRRPPYIARAFERYVIWKSLPSLFKGLSQESLERHGIDDAELQELLQIKNQTQFMEAHKIDGKNTLTDWNKRIEEEDLLKKERKGWVKKLISNAMAALYREAVAQGDAARIKLLLEYGDDFVGKSEVRSPELEKIGESIRKIAERKPWD